MVNGKLENKQSEGANLGGDGNFKEQKLYCNHECNTFLRGKYDQLRDIYNKQSQISRWWKRGMITCLVSLIISVGTQIILLLIMLGVL